MILVIVSIKRDILRDGFHGGFHGGKAAVTFRNRRFFVENRIVNGIRDTIKNP